MPRPLWSGVLTFGLVNVPIRLVTAVREKRVHFNLLNEDGTCRLRRKLYCPETGEEYDFKQTSRGYEIAPDQYVIVDEDELEKIKPESGRTMEITEFVPLASIDPIYFDRTYYIVPDEGGAKAYALLTEAMEATKNVAIARFAMRQREYTVTLRLRDGALTAHTMHYHDEVIPVAQLDESMPRDVTVNKKEKDIARQLIDALTGEFDPTQYRDEYREAVEELIEKKAEGKKVVTVSSQEPEELPPTYDLMAALKASVEGGGSKGGKKGKSKSKRKKTSRKAG